MHGNANLTRNPEVVDQGRSAISSAWAARPIRPRWSERTDSAVPIPFGWGGLAHVPVTRS